MKIIPYNSTNMKGPESVSKKVPPKGVKSVVILAMGTFAVGTDAYIIAGFLPEMAQSLGVMKAAAAQSLTVFAVCYAVMSPILASLTIKLPRRPLLIGALVLLSLANVLGALSSTLWQLLGARVVAAMGAAIYTPTAGAVAARLVNREQRGQALSIVIGGLTLSTALGVPLGSLASHWLGWRSALTIVSGLSLLAAVGVGWSLPRLPGQAGVSLKERLAVVRFPGVSTVLLLTVLGMGATYTVYAYSLPVMGEIGLSRHEGVFMLFLYGMGAVLGTFASGRATDRYGPRRILFGNYFTMAAAFLLFALTAVQQHPLMGLAGFAAFLWGATSFAQTPPQQHRLIALEPEHSALLLSLNASAIYLGIGLGTMLGGIAIAHGAEAIFLTAGTMAICAFFYLWGTRVVSA